MGKTDEAVRLALKMADDPTHGYDQAYRWGPDYDCSSFIISAWQDVGVPLKTAGASYTGNMKSAALRCGFRDVTEDVNRASGAGLQLGDILLNEASHVAMYIGNGNLVHASINEHGGITGGKPGDQTGREICVRSYYSAPWDCVLRYSAANEPVEPEAKTVSKTDELPVLRRGSRGVSVLAMQAVLILRGWPCGPEGADGDFGPATEAALRRFQCENGLEEDGICGPATWAALLGV